MMRSTDRIKTTHAGALPRPDDLRQMIVGPDRVVRIETDEHRARLKSAVAEIVRKQVACGLDSVNDGELSKSSFNTYLTDRVAGYELRDVPEGAPTRLSRLNMINRDARKFGDYFANRRLFATPGGKLPVCVEPLRYIGQDKLQRDITNFKAALANAKTEEAFLPANTPGTMEHWLRNDFYKTDEELVYALADVLHVEYKAITDAGLTLQIDNPDLPDCWGIFPDMDVAQFRRYAGMRVEALNHALRDIPREQIRLHVCWGSFHGPHADDIPLTEIIDLIFKIKAESYSLEASNPVHEHEWRVFETVKLPDGATFVPGVVGHASDFIEHPDLVADRLERYAKLMGRENVIAGTDCGLGPRVGHPSIVWAKLEALAEGARRATKRLWAK
ncbi:MAG TPA: cobalamin-independent methionine synthase II family protein [Stellaceae bacterium]